MADKRQNPPTSPAEEDRTGDPAIPSHESQWLDVVSYPAPLLPPRIEPQQPLEVVDDPVPLQVVESTEPQPIEAPIEPQEPRIVVIRTVVIIVLATIFLLSWQQKAGEESTIDPITAATILDN
ncbi:MAG: hypothetical protein HRU16_02040 [Planctomycetes bacterium]|nr:hypothetical protein [Planctomycetota bacterium]